MNLRDHFAHWEVVRKGLMRTISMFQEEEIGFTPYETAWSVGDILLHIAQTEDGWIRYGIIQSVSDWPSEYTLKNFPTFDSIKAKLSEVHSQTNSFLASIKVEDIDHFVELPWKDKLSLRTVLWHLIEHEIHHRGELSLILGILGRQGLEV